MRKWLCVLIALLVFGPGPVWAVEALVGLYTVGEAETEVAVNANGAVRAHMLENGLPAREWFMLIEGGHRWLVVEHDGALHAFDGVAMDAVSIPPDLSRISINATGRSKTVAGYDGVVYEIDDMGDKIELVVGDDADVVCLSPGITYLFQDMQLLMFDFVGGAGTILEQLNREGGKPWGLLEFGEISLKEINRRDMPEAYFKLPDNVKIVDVNE